MEYLKAMEAICSFNFSSNQIHDLIRQLGAFCVMPYRPIIAATTFTVNVVVWAIKTTLRARFNVFKWTRLWLKLLIKPSSMIRREYSYISLMYMFDDQ